MQERINVLREQCVHGGGLFTRYSNDAGLADRRWDEERQSVSDTRCVRAMRFEQCIDPVSHRSMFPPRERCADDLMWCVDQTVFPFKCQNISRPFTRSVIRISIKVVNKGKFLSLFFFFSFFFLFFFLFRYFRSSVLYHYISNFRNEKSIDSLSLDRSWWFLTDREH